MAAISVLLGLLTLLGLAINSGLAWREERETSALELLAVTPMSGGGEVVTARLTANVRALTRMTATTARTRPQVNIVVTPAEIARACLRRRAEDRTRRQVSQ